MHEEADIENLKKSTSEKPLIEGTTDGIQLEAGSQLLEVVDRHENESTENKDSSITCEGADGNIRDHLLMFPLEDAEQTTLDKRAYYCMIEVPHEEIPVVQLPVITKHHVNDVLESKKNSCSVQDCDMQEGSDYEVEKLKLVHKVAPMDSTKLHIGAKVLPILFRGVVDVTTAQAAHYVVGGVTPWGIPCLEAMPEKIPFDLSVEALKLVKLGVKITNLLDYSRDFLSLTYGEYMTSTYTTTEFASILIEPGGIFYPVRTQSTTLRIEILAKFVSLLFDPRGKQDGHGFNIIINSCDFFKVIIFIEKHSKGGSIMPSLIVDSILLSCGLLRHLVSFVAFGTGLLIGSRLEDVSISTKQFQLRLLQGSAKSIIKCCKFIMTQELAELHDQSKMHQFDDSVKDEFRFRGSCESYDFFNKELTSWSISKLLRELAHGSNVLLKMLLEPKPI